MFEDFNFNEVCVIHLISSLQHKKYNCLSIIFRMLLSYPFFVFPTSKQEPAKSNVMKVITIFS